jgi:hypothetical protein
MSAFSWTLENCPDSSSGRKAAIAITSPPMHASATPRWIDRVAHGQVRLSVSHELSSKRQAWGDIGETSQ